jgi:GDPmannose 4,6-dehydratase
MINLPFADDFIVATGQSYSIKDFLNTALEKAEGFKNISWSGNTLIDRHGKTLVQVNKPEYCRTKDVLYLKGSSKKLQAATGWQPLKSNFDNLIQEMLEYDM